MKINLLPLTVIIATTLSAPTIAADWFIGGGIGAQQNTYKGYVNSAVNADEGLYEKSNFKDTDNNEFYELRAGVFLNDNNRVYGTYSYNSDDASRQQSFMVSYDYLIGLDASNKLNWFVGATAGTNHVNMDIEGLDSSNRFVWGGQTGLMYKLSDNISTEVGYRYLKQSYDIAHSDETSLTSISLNDSQQLYLSLDYRF